MRMHQLMPNLYVSGWPDAKTLLYEQFDVVVTCCRKDLPDHYKGIIPQHYHFPMSDSAQIPGKVPPEVTDAVHIVVLNIFLGKKVLVHCYAGHNRSWLVATMAHAHLRAKSYAEAYQHTMETYDRALQNPAFVEYLNDSTHYWQRPVWQDSVGHVDA